MSNSVDEVPSVIGPAAWINEARSPDSFLVDDPDFASVLSCSGGSLLIASRADSTVTCLSAVGEQVQVQCISVPSPMGIALAGHRLAIGCAVDIRTFADISHDPCEAVFVTTGSYATGAVSVHDVAWGFRDELWFVNTRFSCLATVENGVGFRVKWVPKFIDWLEPTDRCHLNGAAFQNGAPIYMTALSDLPPSAVPVVTEKVRG